MERLSSGEDDAAREVFHRFAGRLVVLARRQFNRRLSHRVDPEDLVQSAFISFFVRHRRGGFRLDDWDDVWSLLTRHHPAQVRRSGGLPPGQTA